MSAEPGSDRVAVGWQLRPEPLPPVAVAALGPVAVALGRRLLAFEAEQLGRLQGVSGEGLLLLLGAAEDLPWVPGVVYLGREVEAPSLLLPTTLAPTVPTAPLLQAFQKQFPELVLPLAVLPASGKVVSLHAARTVARERVLGWLGGIGQENE
ncbi:MAG: hypothetical protein K0Q72_1899 [Armatimonadetes bacterium]|nr:hypothetical protein [Armatimonadota bacterium]